MIKKKEVVAALEACKEMREHYHELLDVSSVEHRFQLLRADHLRAVLDEILTFTKDTTVIAVIKNEKERDDLDKIIHSRIIFDK